MVHSTYPSTTNKHSPRPPVTAQALFQHGLTAKDIAWCRWFFIYFAPDGQEPQLFDVQTRKARIALVINAFCAFVAFILCQAHDLIFYIGNRLNFYEWVTWTCFFVFATPFPSIVFGHVVFLGSLYEQASLEIQEIRARNVQEENA